MFKRTRLAILGMIALVIVPTFFFTSCEELNLPLNQSEVAAALREALKVSSDTSVNQASKEDGYYANLAVRILLPEEVQQVQGYVRTYVPGGEALMSSLVVKLNRAAEDAAVKATPILIDAITNITITDAMGILNGTDSAATVYLKTSTFTSLKTAFKPDIENSLQAVGAQQAWNSLTTNYNTYVAPVPFINAPPINTDLADYTTGKALDGLFHYVKLEEEKIRKDPLHRVTDLLRRVFGSNN
ncbi:DUF4197 domain-containing protein [soil metagenome]